MSRRATLQARGVPANWRMDDESIDFLVLTASNTAQARGYREQLAARQADGRLEGVRRFLVVPDPRGRRAGSGGSTLLVLHELARRLARGGRKRAAAADLFRGRRILIIHSGGDSRRLPAFAAEGKVFAPLACELWPGMPATLFDVVLDDLRSVSMGEHGGVLVAAGDLLLGVTRLGLQLTQPGITGLAFPTKASVGGRHGVYVLTGQSSPARVADFLQKPTPAAARAAGAIRRDGRVLVDSGLMAIAPDAAASLLRAAGAAGDGVTLRAGSLLTRLRAGRAPAIDLYEQIAIALASSRDEDGYLSAVAGNWPTEDRALLRSLYLRLRSPSNAVAFRASVADHLDFFHIGTTREYIRRLTARSDVAACRWSAARVRTIGCDSQHAGGGPAIIDHSSSRLRTMGFNLVSLWPDGLGELGTVPRGWGAAWLPIGARGWSCVLFHGDDDGKTSLERGGTLGGVPLARWLALQGMTPEQVWGSDDPERSTWTARLWHIGPPRDVWNATRWMWRGRGGPPRGWARQRRFSLAELVTRVDHVRLIAARGRRLSNAARSSIHSMDMRTWLAASAPGVMSPRHGRPAAEVTVSAPVRIDLAGGWSDTPPICHGMGGAVVNMAITLEGAPPVQATAKRIADPIIRLRSVDLAREAVITSSKDLLHFRDPADWTSLAKAAVCISADGQPPRPFASVLDRFGGGIDLTLHAAVPKGSGLGTSSILGATVLAALARLRGNIPAAPDLINRVTTLEQLLTTGGGWQDQAAGVLGGVHVLRTQPGADQTPRAERLHLGPEVRRMFAERTLLYFTGYQRLAANILHQIVGRYLENDPRTLRTLGRIKDHAELVREAVRSDDPLALARGLGRAWALKRKLDPGASNRRIEAIVDLVTADLDSALMPGAGGGGFLLLVARSAAAAERIRRLLNRTPPNRAARFVEFAIAAHGLQVRTGSTPRRARRESGTVPPCEP